MGWRVGSRQTECLPPRASVPLPEPRLIVIHVHETEPMRRGSSACRRPVSGLQDLRETVGGPFTQPYVDDRSNHRANHVFQKPVGIGFNQKLIALANDRESLQMTDGVGVVRQAALEGGKVLCPDQSGGRLSHGILIQRSVDMPDECTVDGGFG